MNRSTLNRLLEYLSRALLDITKKTLYRQSHILIYLYFFNLARKSGLVHFLQKKCIAIRLSPINNKIFL